LSLLSESKKGDRLPGLKKTVTQPDIDRYAVASRDFNPVHIDWEFARKSPLGGTIAHGMLVLAYVSQMFTEAFGIAWLTGGKLSVRFKAPARPDDTLTINANVTGITDNGGGTLLKLDVNCLNQHGETVITGEAAVKIANGKDS